MSAETSPIRISAALLRGTDGRMLLVRKAGTRAFMQPGGKIEPAEGPLDALVRELVEEIGLDVDRSRAAHLGRFAAPAANEPGRIVEAEVFALDVSDEDRQRLAPAAEIAEMAWIDPVAPGVDLAPLSRDHILPLRRGALRL